MSLEILYTARERIEFTRATFELMMRNTDWAKVDKVIVVDDGSKGEVKFELSEKVVEVNRSGDYPEFEMWHTKLHSPPALMNYYISRTTSDAFVKIDNDIALPFGWLNALLQVWEDNPELELLGMEAGMTRVAWRDGEPWDHVYRWRDCTNIGGVGLMRTERFRQLPPIPERGYFGWTEHQQLYRWIRGWIEPDLMVPQLDRIPHEPWASLTEHYKQRGWNRDWSKYDDNMSKVFYEWLPEDLTLEGATA